jgi:hypothetical protein
MLTTTEAFDKFRQNLELSQTESKDAQRRHAAVRERIRMGFEIESDFLSGSYARHTKTKPLKDVDILFVLGEAEKWRRSKPPIEVLQAFEECLKKEYDEVGIGRRSVTVEFEKPNYADGHEGKILSIDAVPAFQAGADYEIPDKLTGAWVKTNPGTHAEKATAKNEQLDGQWKPLVKMVKAWNRANGQPIKPSFLLEVMAQRLIDPPFSSYPEEVRNFFAMAAGSIHLAWPDPAGLGPPVSDQMTPQFVEAARTALRQAELKAAVAMRAERDSQGEALRLWREILGDYFPLS